MGKLTALEVKAAAAGYHGDGAGLWLQVTASGAKTWVYRFTLAGKAREMGLGPAHTISLAQARMRATECRRQRHAGVDPIEARRAERGAADAARARAMTFDQCADAYVAAQEAGWRNIKHRAQWVSTLATYASPVFGGLPVQAVDQALVLAVLDPLWHGKTETASRLRGRIEKVLDYATSRGLRVGDNPARWKGHLALHLARPSKITTAGHHSALPYGELAAFMAKLREQEGNAARALQFTILTAARTSEVTDAKWEEVDMQTKVWTVPAARMKGGREHRVPLSPAALTILRAMRRDAMEVVGPIFPARTKGGGLSNMSMAMVLRRMKRADLTVHGFRSCFRDWAGDATEYPGDLAEMALAHTIKDKVEAAYRRGDMLERRAVMMAAWAEFADRLPVVGDKVVAMRVRV